MDDVGRTGDLVGVVAGPAVVDVGAAAPDEYVVRRIAVERVVTIGAGRVLDGHTVGDAQDIAAA